MNAVIDEDLPRFLAKTLTELKFVPLDIRDQGLRGAPDEAVFAYAQQKQAVLFSADLGFSNILRFPLNTHYGIVILRFPNELSTRLIHQQVKQSLKKINTHEYKGNLIIVSPAGVRLRRSLSQ